jgi:hypothetical protein
MVKFHRTEVNTVLLYHLGADNGISFGNRVFADGIKDLEMRSPWISCVIHSIGPGRHIGIWSSSIELRGMVSFPKGVTWDVRMGPYLEIGSLQVGLRILR